MKQNCKYFSYVRKLYFLEIKEILVMFSRITSFRLREESDSTTQILCSLQMCFLFLFLVRNSLLDGGIHSCKYRTCTHVLDTKTTQRIVPSIWYPGIYFFHVDFCVFFLCDTAFIIVHMHVFDLRYTQNWHKPTKQPTN